MKVYFSNIIIPKQCLTLTISSKSSTKPHLKSKIYSGKSDLLITSQKNSKYPSKRKEINSYKRLKLMIQNIKALLKNPLKKSTNQYSKMINYSWSTVRIKYSLPKNFTILYMNQLKNSINSCFLEDKNMRKWTSIRKVKKGKRRAKQTNKNGKMIQINQNIVIVESLHLVRW